MKKALFALLLFATASCSSETKQERLISQYIKHNANEPSSYEPISFGRPRLYRLNELPGASRLDTTIIGVIIEHEYRAKNKFGALTKEDGYFVVSSLNDDVLAVGPEGKGY